MIPHDCWSMNQLYQCHQYKCQCWMESESNSLMRLWLMISKIWRRTNNKAIFQCFGRTGIHSSRYIAISVQPPNTNVDIIYKQEIIKTFIYICCLFQIVDDLSLSLLFQYILFLTTVVNCFNCWWRQNIEINLLLIGTNSQSRSQYKWKVFLLINDVHI